jgi:hemerythrin-like domain-containing protein
MDDLIPEDDPLELLLACHDKVLRFTSLLRRLGAHVGRHGADHQAAEAAQSVIRYFDLASPLHHQDEEEDLFPALRVLGHPQVDLTLDFLATEHRQLEVAWRDRVRPWLQAIVARQPMPMPGDVQWFAERCEQHVALENNQLYPHASELPARLRAQLARNMVNRRRVQQAAA